MFGNSFVSISHLPLRVDSANPETKSSWNFWSESSFENVMLHGKANQNQEKLNLSYVNRLTEVLHICHSLLFVFCWKVFTVVLLPSTGEAM